MAATEAFRTCPLCEAMCGVKLTLEAGVVTRIEGDDADPFSQGHICPKAAALKDFHEDPDRLRFPVRRTATGWEEIDWNTAFDEAAKGLRTVQERHGRDSIGVYLGNPNVHNYGSLLFLPGLIKALGTRNRFSATSVDQLPHQFVAYWMFGHQLLLPVPDIDRTDFWLILGANPAASNGSLMTAPGVKRRLKAIQARGGRVMVVDPRRTETAALADTHLFIKPGSDALLLLALLQTIVAEQRVNLRHLEAFVDGLETVKALVEPFTPERVAEATGIDASTIRQLARDFAAAPSAVCYGRIGTSVQTFGSLCNWLINLLNILTGNLDRAGGAMWTRPAADVVAAGGKGNWDRWRSRVRGLPEFSGELPVSVLVEEMETAGEGQIRGLVTVAGNPVLSTPNGAALDRACADAEWIVAIDCYRNETTRHANIILPPTGPLEHDHYDLTFNVLAIRNVAKYSPAIFAAPEGTRHDWEILQELTARLNGTTVEPTAPERLLNRSLRAGPWRDEISLERLKNEPHGVDLGPLSPCLPERLATENKRIDLAPALLCADVTRAEQALRPSNGGLRLIGRRQLRSNNSWMHNYQRLVKGDDRCTLLMNPADASRLGLQNGQHVTITSRVGSIAAPLEISDTMMEGVVSLPHGWGHNRPNTQLHIANQHAGTSLNDLTDPAQIDPVSGNAVLNGVLVTVE